MLLFISIGLVLIVSLGALFMHVFSYGEVVVQPTVVNDVIEYVQVETPTITYPEPFETLEVVDPTKYAFIEIIQSCGTDFAGSCVRARSGPGTEYPVSYYFRNSTVLAVDGVVEVSGRFWYHVVFDEELRYPERVMPSMYIAGEYVRGITQEELEYTESIEIADKKILVSISEQRLRAYNGDELYMDVPVSTGLSLSPTTLGTFTIFKKMPSRYMQGPLKGVTEDEWDLPGVPWNMYFSHSGEVIHGAYWHNKFGRRASHGCINLSPQDAEKLYRWTPIATEVVITQ